jgi:addiction module RelE/StbE family toxin
MTYKVLITDAALRDLDDSTDYLIHKLKNKPGAIRLYDALQADIGKLEEPPFLFECVRDPLLKAKGYRKIVIENYIVLYSVNEELRSVTLARIFHGRQNYMDLL